MWKIIDYYAELVLTSVHNIALHTVPFVSKDAKSDPEEGEGVPGSFAIFAINVNPLQPSVK